MPIIAQITASGPDLWPLTVLVLSVGLIILLITVARVHAFFALAIAAFAVGILSHTGSLPGEVGKLSSADVLAPQALAAQLSGQDDAVSAFLWPRLSPEGRAALSATGTGEAALAGTRNTLKEELNALVIGPSLYREEVFAEVVLSEDTKAVIASGRGAAVTERLNRLLLEDAYPAGLAKSRRHHWVYSVELATKELGNMAGKIAIVIGLAAAIGMCLMESGAADKVVRRFLAVFGEKRAGFAICVSGYILSIPIFFDTFFMLLLPLAQALALRMGRNYVLYVLAICCGGVVTHSLVIPHPGPLAMADTLGIRAGLTVWVGILVGIVPVMVSWQVAKWLNRKYPVPVRESSSGSLEGLKRIAEKPESELPSFVASIAPVLVPIFLISFASTLAALPGLKASWPTGYAVFEFLGERNIALLIGVLMAMAVLIRQRATSARDLQQLLGHPLGVAAVVILITSAGGAYGLMLRNIGVGDTVKELVAGREINLVLLAWLVTAVIRVAQGSATVAMLTSAALVYPLIGDGSELPFHPVYIFLAIGFGAMILSWMNDSGFWVISKLSGFTEGETLRTWTVIATVNSLTGIAFVYVLSKALPFAPG